MSIAPGIDVPAGVTLDRLTVAQDGVELQLVRRRDHWAIEGGMHDLPPGLPDHLYIDHPELGAVLLAARSLCRSVARWREARYRADEQLRLDFGYWRGAHAVPDPPQQADTASTGVAAD